MKRLVSPQGLDEGRAGAVGGGRDRPDERGGLERSAPMRERSDDEETLPWLKIQTDLDRQVAVDVEMLFEIRQHGVQAYN